MTRLPCVRDSVALLDAAVESSKVGDTATALTHLLAAAEALDAENRPSDARRVRDLARSLGVSR
jgi:hypothetical protein